MLDGSESKSAGRSMLIDYTRHRGEGCDPLKHSKEENVTIHEAFLISSASRRAAKSQLQSLPLDSTSLSIRTTACSCTESTHHSPDSSLNSRQYDCCSTFPTLDDEPALECTTIKRCGPACIELTIDDAEERIAFTLKIPARKDRGNQKAPPSSMPSDWKGRFESLCRSSSPPVVTKKPIGMIRSILVQRKETETAGVLLMMITYSS